MSKKLVIKPAVDTSKLTDEELIAEMYKRFIIPQFYTRDQIVDHIEEAGIEEPAEEQIDAFIENFKSVAYSDADDSLTGHIENWFLWLKHHYWNTTHELAE